MGRCCASQPRVHAPAPRLSAGRAHFPPRTRVAAAPPRCAPAQSTASRVRAARRTGAPPPARLALRLSAPGSERTPAGCAGSSGCGGSGSRRGR
eukprot:1193521-Prorocentrum_minimum.AAC.5